MHVILGYKSVSSFSHIRKITTFQRLKNKLDNLTDIINFGESPSLSLESLSVVTSIQYVCYYCYDENKSDSSVNELQYRML